VLEEIERGQSVEYAEALANLARLVKYEKEIIRDNTLEFPRVDNTEARQMQLSNLVQSIDILEFCLGFDHPRTGEAYKLMGLACKELRDHQRASVWLRRAFCIFYKTLGRDHEATI
jgi:hypothetical protein